MSDENPASNQPDEPANGGPELQAAKPINPIKAGRPETNSDLQDVKKELTGYEKSTLIWTGVVVGINLLTCFFVGLQWREMKSGSADTHTLAVQAVTQATQTTNLAAAASRQAEQTQQLVGQMKRQADRTQDLADRALQQATATVNLARAAKQQADVATSALEFQERPWIGLERIHINDKVAKDSTISNSLIYKNWGTGPAIHVLNEYQVGMFCGDFPAHPTYQLRSTPAPLLLPPGQSTETGTTKFLAPLTEDMITAIKQPICGLYVFGRITYKDKSGHSHWRHICGKWDPATDNTFEICNAYNDGDEDYSDGIEP